MKELEEMKKAFDEFMAKAEQTLVRMKGTAPKEILDKEEKKYLENFLRPFRNKVKHIYKNTDIGKTKEWLCFYIGNIWYSLPMFDKNTMYKGMESKKEYTIKELGLFEGE